MDNIPPAHMAFRCVDDGVHGTAAPSHPLGEMPLHAMTKAAAFLPLQISKKTA